MKGQPKFVLSLHIIIVGLVAVSTFGQADTWTIGKSSQTPRRNEAVATLNGLVYAAGGAAPEVTSSLTTVETYDPSADIWTTRTPLLIATQGAAAAAMNGLLYVVGGGTCCSAVSSLQVYDPQFDTWSVKTSMPTARYYPRAAVVGNRLYVIGGGSGYGTDYSGLVESYDPATDRWTTRTAIPNSRGNIAVAVAHGILYVIGGTISGLPVSTVEAYDPQTDTWIRKAPMPTPRYSLTASVVGGLIYAVGGSAGYGSLGTVEAYDPTTDGWTTMPSMPVIGGQAPTMASAIIDGKLYVVDGINSSPLTVQTFTPTRAVESGYANLVTNGTFDNGVENWITSGAPETLKWSPDDMAGSAMSGSLSTTVSSAYAAVTPVIVRPGRQYLFTAMWRETYQPLQPPCNRQELQVYDSNFSLVSGNAVLLVQSEFGRIGQWNQSASVFTAAATIHNPSKVSLLENCGTELHLDNVGLFQLTPEIDSFAASQSTVTPGVPVKLSWHITGGDLAFLNGERVPLSDTRVVVPTSTTTYTLEARNSGHVPTPYNIVLPSSLVPPESDRRSLIVTTCEPPVVQIQPLSQTIPIGQKASLSLNVLGAAANYQWFVGVPPNGIPIDGANGPTLTVLGSSAGMTNYYAAVRGCGSSVTSGVATVVVLAPSCGQLNASTVSIRYLGTMTGCRPGGNMCNVGEALQFLPSVSGYSFGCVPQLLTWDFGDGAQIVVSSPDAVVPVYHLYSAPGVYTVKLTISNGPQAFVTYTNVQISSGPGLHHRRRG